MEEKPVTVSVRAHRHKPDYQEKKEIMDNIVIHFENRDDCRVMRAWALDNNTKEQVEDIVVITLSPEAQNIWKIVT